VLPPWTILINTTAPFARPSRTTVQLEQATATVHCIIVEAPALLPPSVAILLPAEAQYLKLTHPNLQLKLSCLSYSIAQAPHHICSSLESSSGTTRTTSTTGTPPLLLHRLLCLPSRSSLTCLMCPRLPCRRKSSTACRPRLGTAPQSRPQNAMSR
jgi:hypothetical protein